MSELLKDLKPTVEIFKKELGGYIVVHPEQVPGTSNYTARIRIFESLKDEVLPYLQVTLETSERVKDTRVKALAQLAMGGWTMGPSGRLVQKKKAVKKKVKRKRAKRLRRGTK